MYIRSFVVNGRGAFPVDMLRYDHCYPETSADVDRAFCEKGERIVRLVTRCSGKHEAGLLPTEGRWRSFTWPVISKSDPKRVSRKN